MANSKNHSTHNQSPKWHRIGIKKPHHKYRNLLRGSTSSSRGAGCLRRSTTPEEDAGKQCKDSERMCRGHQSPCEAEDAKGLNSKLSRLAFIAHPKLGKWISSNIVKARRLCHPKPKAQTKEEASAPAQAPKGAQALWKAP
ncbi:large ribosomal subunit protein eL29-like [Peromyscus maniculatus bairdii]|uniref:large ribosomal subunit protein eL29-like n=1 Tax=Peromyscus maniculatus bairdii TaxID=230844 RepID=UPI001C2E2089|nr:60S ribosomal protein L29-like [Peromyscus maniculatus bairdii]